MSNSNDNEIDDILNEIKQRNADNDSEQVDEPVEEVESEPTEEVAQPVEEEPSEETAEEPNEEPSEEEAEDFEIVDDKLTSDNNGETDIMQTVEDDEEEKGDSNKKKVAIIAIVIVLIVAVAVGVYAYMNTNKKEPETTTESTTVEQTTVAPVVVKNPLTNEDNYNESALNQRPVAIVVENAADARPQWGMDDETNAPDIILEGEVEGGETRMLWFYADYTSLPDQIGPIRSARPPFIKFSELFDSIFIHWGQSSSKGNYVGANTVFSEDNVDHINQMAYSDKVGLFGRDKSRGVSSEHTGVLYGSALAEAIAQQDFRTEINDNTTSFSFNDEATAVGTDSCTTLNVKFSKSTATKTWTYDADSQTYTTDNYKNSVTRTNLIVLYDTTEYVVKQDYKGSGQSETYCNYNLAGGTGKLASLGTITDITWSVENGALVIKDSEGNDINLNTGKTWIGWSSSNNGGSHDFS